MSHMNKHSPFEGDINFMSSLKTKSLVDHGQIPGSMVG